VTDAFTPSHSLLTIVLADANVLYSRVLRDCLLYAAAGQLISVRWSQRILDELAKHLIANIEGFDRAQARRLFRGYARRPPVDAIVWLTLAATGHPRATETKSKRGPRNR
jgi:predicted nucleic acid-binding protein